MLKLTHWIAAALLACSAQASAGAEPEKAIAQPARSNWVVARAGREVYAFYGLGVGKTHADIARDVHRYDLRRQTWQKIGAIPVPVGRLASAAVTVAGQIYLFGGYTVSATGEEASTPEVLRFDPKSAKFQQQAPMPTPVDDAVALNWRDRWVVLVSGWHDTANVNYVQLYDTRTNTWRSGSDWPGKGVFGHSGAMVGDIAVICDGVTAVKNAQGKNQFALSNACWRGDFSEIELGSIQWQALEPHPGLPHYRSGAIGRPAHGNTKAPGEILFAGGSTRAYNYNGIGYDGKAAAASDLVFSIDLKTNRWRVEKPLPVAAMDFRGMIEYNGQFLLFGGMRSGQVVSAEIVRY